MSEGQARSVVAAVALLIASALAALIWGHTAVHVVLVAGLLWVVWDRATLTERLDQAWDDADQAIGRVEAVENHLAATEPPSAGRHASGVERAYRSLRDVA